MWIVIHALGIFFLTDLLKSVDCQPSPTKNPECPGMHKAAQHVGTGIRVLLGKSSTCTVNKHCSGINCKWANGGLLEVELRHCEKPIKYHLHFKSPDHSVNVEQQLGNGQSIRLYKTKHTAFVIKVTELKRTGNTVTTKIDLLTCSDLTLGACFPTAPLLQRQKFCVSMRNCPGYNASSSEYAPCTATTSNPSKGPSASGHVPHSRWSTRTHGATADPGKNHQPTQKSEENKDDELKISVKGNLMGPQAETRSLSVAAIVGISIAGLFIIVIVAGVLVYWKKYHRRSRLRAAYYNDISMHDPLYEDFGPEVA